MSREWRDGDVAMVTCKTPPHEFAASRTKKGWNSIDDTIGFAGDWDVVDARPLLLIDPEDREQVERLAQEIFNNRGYTRAALADALRSLVAPPKPDEPTDPKACVTDRRENIWRQLADGDWVCTSGPDVGEYLAWDALTERGPLGVQA